jgi:hypothetical protein
MPIPLEQAEPKKPPEDQKRKPGWEDKVFRVANRRLRAGWEQAKRKEEEDAAKRKDNRPD